MSNLKDPPEITGDGLRAVRVGQRAGAEELGASVYELEPGDEMVYHYHVQREELLIVLAGRLSLRTAGAGRSCQKGRSSRCRAASGARMGIATAAISRYAC